MPLSTLLRLGMLLLLLCPLTVWAQIESNPKRPSRREKTIFDSDAVISDDSSFLEHKISQLAGEFWKVRSPYFRNSKTATFNFMAPNGRFYLGIGGYVNYMASYDFGGIVDDPDFGPYNIPVPQTGYNKSQFRSNAWNSTLDFRVVQRVGKHAIVGYINAQYVGVVNSGNFALQEGWLSYRGVLVGYNFSTFDDVAAQPPTVNADGMNAMSNVQNSMVRFTHPIGKRWKWALAIEQPLFSQQDVPAGEEALLQRMPDIPAYVQYTSGNGNSYLRLSGIVRNLAYRDFDRQQNKSLFAWGTQLSGVYMPNNSLQFYYQLAGGRGIGEYLQDLNGNGYDLRPLPGGKLGTLPVWGGYLTMQYNINAQVFCTLGYSQVRVYADGRLPDAAYRLAYMGTANVFWNFLPNAQVALEYDFGRRVDQDWQGSNANRIYVMAQYNF